MAIQVGLVDLLDSWNLVPRTVEGHSSGEIAAAYCAGKISRQVAWGAAYWRGVVCAQLSGESGTMLAAGITEEQAEEALKRLSDADASQVMIGCYNSPKNLTFTGKAAAMSKLKSELDKMGVFSRALPVNVAYHSPDLEIVADEYRRHLATVEGRGGIIRNGKVLMHSSLTGLCIAPSDEIDDSYWIGNLVNPVKFSAALLGSLESETATDGNADRDTRTIVEVGVHSALRSAIRESLSMSNAYQSVGYVSLMKRGETRGETILHAMGYLYTRGYDINVARVNREGGYEHESSTRQLGPDLPPYDFCHSIRRATTRQIERLKFPTYGTHELLGSPMADSNAFEQRWRNVIRSQDIPWLGSNKVP